MENYKSTYGFSKEEWDACIKVLRILKDDPFNNPDNQDLATLITSIHKQAKKVGRNQSAQEKKTRDLEVIKATEIAKKAFINETTYASGDSISSEYTPLEIPKNCYCCNTSFDNLHSFYNRLCPVCAEENYHNRFRTIDLSNRNVILTGGRVKIGFATALKFLRSNANLTITSRFPALALAEFQKQSDYDVWKDNLTVYGLDLRNLAAVQSFMEDYKNRNVSLDILINNAAQTIKYDDAYYVSVINNEQLLLEEYQNLPAFSANQTPISQSQNTLLSKEEFYKTTPVNRFGQPIDDRAQEQLEFYIARNRHFRIARGEFD